MNTTPTTLTTERAKPRLVICDDDSIKLAKVAEQYRERGYEAIPILVAAGPNDALFADGRIVQGEPNKASDDWEEQDRYKGDPVRTVQAELALARHKTGANPTREHFGTDLEIFSAMATFTYGAKSKEELRALLAELKPDCILSDYQMRMPKWSNPEEGVMGPDVMEMAAEMYPNAPRAIHTGMYAFKDNEHFQEYLAWPDHAEEYCADVRAASEGGYVLLGKDQGKNNDTCAALDRYFRMALEKGCPPRIVMGEPAPAKA